MLGHMDKRDNDTSPSSEDTKNDRIRLMVTLPPEEAELAEWLDDETHARKKKDKSFNRSELVAEMLRLGIAQYKKGKGK